MKVILTNGFNILLFHRNIMIYILVSCDPTCLFSLDQHIEGNIKIKYKHNKWKETRKKKKSESINIYCTRSFKNCCYIF